MGDFEAKRKREHDSETETEGAGRLITGAARRKYCIRDFCGVLVSLSAFLLSGSSKRVPVVEFESERTKHYKPAPITHYLSADDNGISRFRLSS